MRVLAIADGDSRWKWAATVARSLPGPGGTLAGVVVDSTSVPSERQVAEVAPDLGPVRRVPADELLDPEALGRHDVLVVGCSGGRIFSVLGAVAGLDPSHRPLVVTGYWGVVYEKHLEGFLWRVGADVICVNSARDLDRFEGYCGQLGIDATALVRTGIPSIPQRVPVRPRPVRSLAFAVQPDVPRGREDRLYLLERLVEHATTHPDRRVVVKLRAAPGENSTHRELHHYQQLHLDAGLPAPPNLEFAYGPMVEVLAGVDLCLTVSSTAALEALAAGVPTGVVTDLGVRESLGNHVFAGSGCLVSFAELLAGRVPVPEAAWLERNGLGADDRLDNVRERIEHLLKVRHEEGLPPPDRWLVPGRTDRLLAVHAQRYGPAQPAGQGPVAWARRATRATLRGPLRTAYRRVDAWSRR